MPALTPDEVVSRKTATLPEPVLEAFNKLIAQNFGNNSARVTQEEAISAILVAMPSATRESIFARHYLDVEEIYRAAGWKVLYDKPGYNESGEAYFVFTRKG